MKFKAFSSDREIYVNTTKYAIDWDRVVSRPQKKVKDFLRAFWEHKKILEELLIPGSKKRVDLCNITDMVIVEVSPKSSHEFNKFFDKNRSAFWNKLKTGNNKRAWAERCGFDYIVLVDEDLKNLDKDYLYGKFGLVL